MTFAGPAEEDLREILRLFPKEFTTDMAVEATGWPLKKVRQAIVMGLSQDRVMSREINQYYRIYENVAWRREWVTKRWAA